MEVIPSPNPPSFEWFWCAKDVMILTPAWGSTTNYHPHHSLTSFHTCFVSCRVQLWDTERPDGNITMVHSCSMRQFNWGYTQFSQFNADDTLLLVSGVYLGPHHSSSGEIAVLSLGRNCSTVMLIPPVDHFGCFYFHNTHLSFFLLTLMNA